MWGGSVASVQALPGSPWGAHWNSPVLCETRRTAVLGKPAKPRCLSAVQLQSSMWGVSASSVPRGQPLPVAPCLEFTGLWLCARRAVSCDSPGQAGQAMIYEHFLAACGTLRAASGPSFWRIWRLPLLGGRRLVYLCETYRAIVPGKVAKS